MQPSQTSSQISSPALWVSGGALITSLGAAVYLNKQLSAVNDEIQKHGKRLSSAIIELARIKSLGGNVNKIAEATKILNIEGGRQNVLINEMKDLISEFDQIFDSLIPQVNNNSQQILMMLNAINEFQDLAKQNGWKIRANVSSSPAVYSESDQFSRLPFSNNESYPPIDDTNQHHEHVEPDKRPSHSHQAGSIINIEDRTNSQNPRFPQNDRSKRSHGYSDQRNGYPDSLRNDPYPRTQDRASNDGYFKGGRWIERGSSPDSHRFSRKPQGSGSVRFALKSDQQPPERNYHSHQPKGHHQTIPRREAPPSVQGGPAVIDFPRTRVYPPYISRTNSRPYNRPTKLSSLSRSDRQKSGYPRTSRDFPELNHRQQEKSGNYEPSSKRDYDSRLNHALNLNLDGDLNPPSDIETTPNSGDDNTKNEILARISL